MKTTRSLPVLSLLGFLLLIAPFYDSCNGHGMKRVEANAEAVSDITAVETVEKNYTISDSIDVAKTKVDSLNNSVENYKESFLEKTYVFIDDEDSQNVLEFAKIGIDNLLEFNFKEFKKEIKDKKYGGVFFILKNLCFLLIVIISFLIVIFSFKNKRLVHEFSKLNLIMLLITVVCLFLEGLFETITQIKWGYYAFIVTYILIFYYSKLALKSNNPKS